MESKLNKSIIEKLNFSEKISTKEDIERRADEIVNSSLKAFKYMKKIEDSTKEEREEEIQRLKKEKTLDPFLNS